MGSLSLGNQMVIWKFELLDLSRSTFYYLPKPASEADLALMWMIDGYHFSAHIMGRGAFEIGCKKVQVFMRTMGVTTVYYPKRNLIERIRSTRYTLIC